MKNNIRIDRNKVFRGIVILIFFIALLIMRGYEPHFRALSDGASTLDMRYHYGSTEAYLLLDTLGLPGRLIYIKILLVDFIFILSFALVQSFILKFAMGEALFKTGFRKLLVIPCLRGLFDIIENISLLIMIEKFPLKIPGLATFSGFSTSVKFVFLGLWLVSILIVLVVRIIQSRKSHE